MTEQTNEQKGELKACPSCGESPKLNADEDCCMCPNETCTENGQWISLSQWNTRTNATVKDSLTAQTADQATVELVSGLKEHVAMVCTCDDGHTCSTCAVLHAAEEWLKGK